MPVFRIAVLAVLALTLLPSSTSGHEIPSDVTIHLFLKPEGQRARLLVRVPMSAMRDVEYPRRGEEGYVDLPKAEFSLRTAAKMWISDNIELYEDDTRLPEPTMVEVRASIMSDKSIASYEQALAHVTGPRLPDDTTLVWTQGLLDILFEYPIQSDRSEFSINPMFGRLGIRTITILRFLPPDGNVRAFEFSGEPGLVRIDPRWHQAALTFVKLGFLHILDGVDHLLFLFCLVIPFRRMRQLLLVVTSFTVAHSFTLIASAYNLAPDALWFPPLVETLIAMSIVYMALENIVGSKVYRRWIITFAFGLIHGFGFSFALRETLQFAGSYMLTSLLSFNVGVELGQLLVLILLIPALDLLFRRGVDERIGTIILSALVAHTGWHWMTERWQTLRQFSFEWPALTAAFMASMVRWAMVLVLAAAIVWFVSLVLKNRRTGSLSDV